MTDGAPGDALAPALVRAAEQLWTAADTGQGCDPVRDLLNGIDDAYAVQEHNTQRHLRSGRRLSGRKIGLTSIAVRGQFGVHEPDFGSLFADTEHGHNSILNSEDFIQPRVEAEVLISLREDLDHDHVTTVDVIRAVDFVGAALEVVDSRIRKWDIELTDTVTDTVADNGSAAAYVIGASAHHLAGLDLAHCPMTLLRNGRVVSSGAGRNTLGHPFNAVVWLARTLHRKGQPLRAGDVVLSGALGPLVVARPGDHFTAEIGGLGHVTTSFE